MGKSFLVNSNQEKLVIDNQAGVKTIQSATEENFINHGMDDLSVLNPKAKFTKKRYINQAGNTFGGGKVFVQPLDQEKYEINKIRFT